MGGKKSRGSDVVSGLRAATCHRQEEKIIAIVEGGGDIDAIDAVSGLTPLTIAAELSFNEMIEVLLQHGADVNRRNRNGWTALQLAAQEGNYDTVKTLVRNGADIDMKTHSWTALLIAADKMEEGGWHSWVASYLVENGADVTAAGYHGRTALHWAAMCGNKCLAVPLIERGAAIDTTDRWRRTSLIWAVQNGQLPMVKLLLDLGANPALATLDGYTPLHIAADFGNLDIMCELTRAGIDVNARAADGYTAYDIVDLMGFEWLKEELEKQGAKRGALIESQASSGQRRADAVDEDWYLGFEQHEAAMTLRQRLSDLTLAKQGSNQED